MTFDFSTIIDRRGTHCEKWDSMETRYGVSPEDGLAMWVADMEFRPPPAVIQALQNMVSHGVFGYAGDFSDYHNAIAGWMKRRHAWHVEPEWIHATHGIVNAMNIIIQAFCRPGDGVVLHTPVYYPFYSAIRGNGCHVVANTLRKDAEGMYRMDMDALAAQVDENTRMFILCSPHNPGGRVWSREELQTLADFCFERDILLVADEVHHDLVYAGNTHTVLATLNNDAADRVITCTSATKSFNLAGTLTGNVIIKNDKLRSQFRRQLHRAGLYEPNAFGVAAATAAYNDGDDWMNALVQHLTTCRDMVERHIHDKIAGATTMPQQGTYLAWIDFSQHALSIDEIVKRVQSRAKLALNHGHTFGPGGENHMRLNFACPTAMLEEALYRLEAALR